MFCQYLVENWRGGKSAYGVTQDDVLLKLFNFFEYVYAILLMYLKDPDRKIRLSRTETSAISEHANKTGLKTL